MAVRARLDSTAMAARYGQQAFALCTFNAKSIHCDLTMKKASKWDSDEEEESGGHKEASVPNKKPRTTEQQLHANQLRAQQLQQLQQQQQQQEEEEEEEEAVRRAEKAKPHAVAAAHHPLFHGCRSIEEYERLNFIDQGTYGLVFKARDKKTREIYAIKQVKLVSSDVGKVGFPITALRETNILLALRHPNIVSVKEMVVGSTNDKVFMVMEYGDNDLKVR